MLNMRSFSKRVVIFARRGMTANKRLSSITTNEESSINRPVKGIDQIPGYKGFPLFRNIFLLIKYRDRSHEFYKNAHDKFGSIFRLRLGVQDAVFTTDTDAIQKLFVGEGRYPKRLPLETWIACRNELNEPHGLVTAEGETWHRNRRAVNKAVLRMTEVTKYAPLLTDVNSELIEVISESRDHTDFLPNIDQHLFNWSLESISAVLYKKRLGCMMKEPDPAIAAYIKAALDMVVVQNYLEVFPLSVTKRLFPKSWRRLVESWDMIIRSAKQHVDNHLDNLEAKPDEGVCGVVQQLMMNGGISRAAVYANVTELMTAAITTSSSIVQFLLYELARNPKIQEKVHQEVLHCLGTSRQPVASDTQNMPLLRSVLKETMRLYPVGTTLSRITEKDLEIQGYKIPAKI